MELNTLNYPIHDRIVDALLRFVRKATMSYKALFSVLSWQQYVFMNLSSPLLQMICFSMVASFANDSPIGTWLVGNALVLTFFNAIFGVGSQLTRERETGTLIMLIASPSNRLGILLPRAILHIFDGLITVVFGFILAFVLFGLRIPFVVYPQLLLVLLAASFSAMSFGIIISCLGLLTRDLNLLLNIAAMALLGLTGANFPVESLPTWLSMLPWLLPLTRSIKLARLLIEGQAMMEHINLLVGEFLIGTVFIVIGFSVFTFIERSAIRKGTLDVL